MAVVGRSDAIARLGMRDALALGAPAWDELLGHAPAASPFMSWAWHDAWASSASQAHLAASEVFVQHGVGGRLDVLLPLARSQLRFRRREVAALTWAIGDFGCPDHLDVLARPGADVDAVVGALEAASWDVLILTNLAEDAANAPALCRAFERHGYAVHWRPLWPCPYLQLPGGWDEYLAGLGTTRRQTLRRKERNLRRTFDVSLTSYGGDRLDEGWRLLVRLHGQRWGGGGVFQALQLDQLHRRFAAALAARSALWLTVLGLNGEPAAAWYGFSAGDTVYYYQSGRGLQWRRESVGAVLMGLMIRRAIEQGFRRFEFLRGEERYKMQWTSTHRWTREAVVFRPGLRGMWLRGLDWAAAARDRLLGSRRA